MTLGVNNPATAAPRRWAGLPRAADRFLVAPQPATNVAPSAAHSPLFDDDTNDESVPTREPTSTSDGNGDKPLSPPKPIANALPPTTLASGPCSPSVSASASNKQTRTAAKRKGKARGVTTAKEKKGATTKSKETTGAPAPGLSQGSSSRREVTVSSSVQADRFGRKKYPWMDDPHKHAQEHKTPLVESTSMYSDSIVDLDSRQASSSRSASKVIEGSSQLPRTKPSSSNIPAPKPSVPVTIASISTLPSPSSTISAQATQPAITHQTASNNTVTSLPETSPATGPSLPQATPTQDDIPVPTSFNYLTAPLSHPAAAVASSVYPQSGSVPPTTSPPRVQSTAVLSPWSNFPACINFVCPPPPNFVAPPAPLPPPSSPEVQKTRDLAELVEMANKQQQEPFSTQAAPFNYVSPTWLSKPLSEKPVPTKSTRATQPRKTSSRAQAKPRPDPPQAQSISPPQTSTVPAGPLLRRVASEPVLPRQASTHFQPVHDAYNSVPQVQTVLTPHVHAQQRRDVYGAPSTQAISSVPGSQVIGGILGIASTNNISHSDVITSTQAYEPQSPRAFAHQSTHTNSPQYAQTSSFQCVQANMPQPANQEVENFSVEAWRAASQAHSPPLVRAQSSPGYPTQSIQPAQPTQPAQPVQNAQQGRSARRVIRPMPKNLPAYLMYTPRHSSPLSNVSTAPVPTMAQKHRMEDDEDDEVQEIPPPHKRFKTQ
ncbi:hypothetical protein FRC07_004328 [Ceratobasidium sp. 392]|nr:hypothetical protein FRC07_004328 [Ceratobasidium sp. 392]